LGGHDNIIRSLKEKPLSELDEAWQSALAEAKQRARAAGRADVAEYLNLRAQNDLLRATAINWLIGTVTAIAGARNRQGAAIKTEVADAHQFRVGNATMVGSRLTLHSGVRALTIECGWPRTPSHGIVRGNGLACGNIKHLGRPRANAPLLLVRSKSGAPQWFILKKDDSRVLFTAADARAHLEILTEA
jgi:hypothetical protein